MRTVAKPVSNMVKSTVKDHETFRRLAVGGARLHARTNARWDRIVRRKPVVDKKGNPIVRRELTEDEAISLITVGVDFGITQVVDGNWGVHAVIKKDIFAGGVA